MQSLIFSLLGLMAGVFVFATALEEKSPYGAALGTAATLIGLAGVIVAYVAK